MSAPSKLVSGHVHGNGCLAMNGGGLLVCTITLAPVFANNLHQEAMAEIVALGVRLKEDPNGLALDFSRRTGIAWQNLKEGR